MHQYKPGMRRTVFYQVTIESSHLDRAELGPGRDEDILDEETSVISIVFS